MEWTAPTIGVLIGLAAFVISVLDDLVGKDKSVVKGLFMSILVGIGVAVGSTWFLSEYIMN